MKYPDFDRAFAQTPEIVSLSIEDAFRKGEKAMKFRHKIAAMLSAAAVIAMAFAIASFALPNEPNPDVLAQPPATNHAAGQTDAEPTPAPQRAEDPMVYYNPAGTYFHYYEHCSGMMGASAHPTTEALAAGKQPCPVCVPDNGGGNWTSYSMNDEVFPNDRETPTMSGANIFESVFGADLFETLGDFEYISTEARGTTSSGGVLIEEIKYNFSDGGGQITPVFITVERQADEILSGNIMLSFVNMTGETFRGQCSPWYRNLCRAADETMENLPIPGAGSDGTTYLPKQLCACFDSQCKPAVCELEYETDSGFVSLSFDIRDDGATLATMNYSAGKA